MTNMTATQAIEVLKGAGFDDVKVILKSNGSEATTDDHGKLVIVVNPGAGTVVPKTTQIVLTVDDTPVAPNPTEGNGSSVRGGAGLPDTLDSALASTRGGAWLQDRFQATGDLTIEPGVRFDWNDVNRRSTVSPRLAASLRLDASTRLRAAGGLYTQSPGYEKLLQSDYLIDLTGGPALDLDSEAGPSS